MSRVIESWGMPPRHSPLLNQEARYWQAGSEFVL